MTFHYIVVGGGSAGCVVAARLGGDSPDNKVLLLESGGLDRSFVLKMPLAFTTLRSSPKFDWGYKTDPEPFAGDRTIPAARGKVLGGSSSINGMMYSRGHPRDYDEWRQLGAEGWSYDEVLPFFKKSERNWRGEGPTHGVSGPLDVVPYTSSEPIAAAIRETARGLGYRVLDDFEAGDPEGFALPDSTIRRGRRASTSQAFLHPLRRRPNLKIVTGAHATRIVIEMDRATGVEYLKDGKIVIARAEREVVLSGGAYASPQLLMLSGIGPADQLREVGAPIALDLSGVGQGLQEHPLVPMGFLAKKPFRFSQQLRADRLALSVMNWLLTGRGVPSSVPLSCVAYYKSRPDLERPDLENAFMSTSLAAGPWFPGWRKPAPDMLTSLNVVLRPGSRGSVRLRSADPSAPPRIQFNLLQDPNDLRLLRHALRWTRDFVRQGALAEHVGAEAFPGAALDADAALDAYIRQTVTTGEHPTSTCKMGVQDDAVVDPQLRVRGIEGLRIADASVMPALIGGHTNAPSIMIGEKGRQHDAGELTANEGLSIGRYCFARPTSLLPILAMPIAETRMQSEPPAKSDSATVLGRGLFWQDMHVGATLRTYTRTITETDLVTFATLTGMVDSTFLDATFVGAMGGRPVPGALTYSFIEGFIVQALIRGTGIAMLACAQEAIAPVHVGDTIHATIEFTSVRPTSQGNRAIVNSTITVFNQRAEPVLRYTSRRMIAGRPDAAE